MMTRKTVLCHFYNEEWLLPFWLKHHRDIFDHGIMINYASTDRSVEIIKEWCPTWQIVDSRNPNFDPGGVDSEVIDYEKSLEGWRCCLNLPEFLIGNYDRLNDVTENTQIFAEQWMFIDMERREEPYYLMIDAPLYKQRWWGYGPESWDFTKPQSHGSSPRSARSIHNYPINYHSNGGTLGRHFWNQKSTYNDLAIFYYGYASLEEGSVKRKMQIQTKCPPGTARSNHQFTFDELITRFRKEQQPLSRDLRSEISPYILAHEEYISKKTKESLDMISEQRTKIQTAIEVLNDALNKLQ